MAKMMMYPKINNEIKKPFEVVTVKSFLCPTFGDVYVGKKINSEGFQCAKKYWFLVEGNKVIPWFLAPEGTTHYAADHLRLGSVFGNGWVKIDNNVMQWNKFHSGWVLPTVKADMENLIPRPTEPDKMDVYEPTPEEDEAFRELDKKLNRESDYADTPFAVRGRMLERMGKLMQDKTATVHDLAKVATEAGMSVHFKIQPEVVVTTDER